MTVFVLTFKSEIELMYCVVIFVDLEPFSNAFFFTFCGQTKVDIL